MLLAFAFPLNRMVNAALIQASGCDVGSCIHSAAARRLVDGNLIDWNYAYGALDLADVQVPIAAAGTVQMLVGFEATTRRYTVFPTDGSKLFPLSLYVRNRRIVCSDKCHKCRDRPCLHAKAVELYSDSCPLGSPARCLD